MLCTCDNIFKPYVKFGSLTVTCALSFVFIAVKYTEKSKNLKWTKQFCVAPILLSRNILCNSTKEKEKMLHIPCVQLNTMADQWNDDSCCKHFVVKPNEKLWSFTLYRVVTEWLSFRNIECEIIKLSHLQKKAPCDGQTNVQRHNWRHISLFRSYKKKPIENCEKEVFYLTRSNETYWKFSKQVPKGEILKRFRATLKYNGICWVEMPLGVACSSSC